MRGTAGAIAAAHIARHQARQRNANVEATEESHSIASRAEKSQNEVHQLNSRNAKKSFNKIKDLLNCKRSSKAARELLKSYQEESPQNSKHSR